MSHPRITSEEVETVTREPLDDYSNPVDFYLEPGARCLTDNSIVPIAHLMACSREGYFVSKLLTFEGPVRKVVANRTPEQIIAQYLDEVAAKAFIARANIFDRPRLTTDGLLLGNGIIYFPKLK